MLVSVVGVFYFVMLTTSSRKCWNIRFYVEGIRCILSCSILNAYLSNIDYGFHGKAYSYKLEPIVSRLGVCVGYECLVEADSLTCAEKATLYQYEINTSYHVSKLVSRWLSKLQSKEYIEKLKNKYIFINLERCNLCEKSIIDEVIILNSYLREFKIILVIEVTERELIFCKGCPHIVVGLKRLSENNIIIAADDYDIFKNDIRKSELQEGIYDFLKVEYENSDLFIDRLSKLKTSLRDVKIIIEKIETKKIANSINIIFDEPCFFMQGYAFEGKLLI